MIRHFREAYNLLRDYNHLIKEAQSQGFIVKLDKFFYDPRTKSYNDEFRKRMKKVSDKFLERNPVQLDTKYNLETVICTVQYAAALFSYNIFHPKRHIFNQFRNTK